MILFSGDLWSFNSAHGDFIISPLPDVSVHSLLPKNDKCLILGSDGLWNMLTPLEAVMVVVENERKFDQLVVNDIVSVAAGFFGGEGGYLFLLSLHQHLCKQNVDKSLYFKSYLYNVRTKKS